MKELAKETNLTAGTASRLTAHPATISLGIKNNPHASGGTRPVLRTRGLVFSALLARPSVIALLAIHQCSQTDLSGLSPELQGAFGCKRLAGP